MAATKHFPISIQFLRQFAEILAKEISVEMPSGLPSFDKLTATDFMEGEMFETIYDFIRKRMGYDPFHPINLYKFVYRYLILKKHNHLGNNGFVDWEIKEKSKFPQVLFHLLGYEKIDDFILDANHFLIDDDTFEKQKALLKKFNETDNWSQEIITTRGQEDTAPIIFLCYSRQDEDTVFTLYSQLKKDGYTPWMDKKDILPGELWERSIEKAITKASFFIACLSHNSVVKRGYLQKEIKKALSVWQEKLIDDIYLIPARLEECVLPSSLEKFQWVDLYDSNGYALLKKSLLEGLDRMKL